MTYSPSLRLTRQERVACTTPSLTPGSTSVRELQKSCVQRFLYGSPDLTGAQRLHAHPNQPNSN
jgi:hypothetical protein